MSEVVESEVKILLEGENHISKPTKDAQKSLEDFSAVAVMTADKLSGLFSKDQIGKAQKMANTIRSFNGEWKADAAKGFKKLVGVSDVSELGDAFSSMTASQVAAIKGLIEEPQKQLTDFSRDAIKAAKVLSGTFTKDEVNNAKEMARAMRNFNEGAETDTFEGLKGVFGAKSVEDLASSFSKLTSSQANALSDLIKEPEKRLTDFSGNARTMATYLSNTFSKKEFAKASEMAASMRKFDEGWKHDTGKAFESMKGVKNVEGLAASLSNLTSTQASALGKLMEEPQNALRPLEKYGKTMMDKAKNSLKGFKKGLDNIGNIIRYRLIRGGLSLLVNQIQEGTKSVYIFARAFKNLDQSNIASTLDKYATLADNIRGNLGAAWATTLSTLSDVLMPFLEKLSEAISKMTMFSAAINGNSTYLKVATNNAKRYFDTVTSGLQEIKVIGSFTRYEEAEIPENVMDFGKRVKENLSAIADVSGGAMTGLGIILIATGHVVAGLGLAAAGLGIMNLGNQLDDNDSKSKIERIFSGISNILPTLELGLGIALIAHGQYQFGIPLLIKGASSQLKKLAETNLNDDLSMKLKMSAVTLDVCSLGLGAILCAFGQYGFGVPLVAAGLVGVVEEAHANWDDIMDLFLELGQKIEVWWWNLWHGNIWADWDTQFAEYIKANEEKFNVSIATEPIHSGISDHSIRDDWRNDVVEEEQKAAEELLSSLQTDGFAVLQSGGFNLKDYKPDNVIYDQKPTSTDGPFEAIGTFLKNYFRTAIEGFKLRYGLSPDEYASGGFPSAGSLFVAGEVPGQTELVGTINGRTGVASGAEITGIRDAIYEVGMQIMESMAENRTVVRVEGDADQIFNVVRSKSEDYTRRTGEFAF